MGFRPMRGYPQSGPYPYPPPSGAVYPPQGYPSSHGVYPPPQGPYPPPHQPPPPGYQGYFNQGQQPYYPPPPLPYDHCHHHCGDEGSGAGFLKGWFSVSWTTAIVQFADCY
uniref:Uncharacterized protein n=1 Tax=Oryza rufipogon TaxID=4529 RepID=A0A0E0QLQ4_ORYRU